MFEVKFNCSSVNETIPFEKRCDLHDDCSDRSDELNCCFDIKNLNYCECSSGECIPAGYSCDDKECGYEI